MKKLLKKIFAPKDRKKRMMLLIPTEYLRPGSYNMVAVDWGADVKKNP